MMNIVNCSNILQTILLLVMFIQHTGGLHKVRWLSRGKGKRGGVRIIYYYKVDISHIRLLLIYKKGIEDDLSESEKKVLRALNEGGGG